MLNLPIAVLQNLLALVLFFQAAAVGIASPQSGAVLRGQVAILGSMNPPNFSSAELAFSYSAAGGSPSGSAGTWFLIQNFTQPVDGSTLAVWDTASITDGDYNLRLRVYLQDGTIQDVTVAGVKIRNDVPVPTGTPTESIQPTVAIQPPTGMPALPTRVYFVSTPLPANPAAIPVASVYRTFGWGALIAMGLFLLVAFLLRPRKN